MIALDRRFFRERDAAPQIQPEVLEDIGRSSPPASAELPTTTGMSPPRLGNRYRLEALIGEGGMGVVYAAIDERLGRPVAVKMVREEQLGPDGLERFQREARAAASLSHPYIVTVHDFGVDEGGAPYLVMERLYGRSLRNTLVADGRMAPDRALAILQGVASAIDAAHAHGLIHRDLKPENVFLSTDHVTKVLDFGIAKVTGATPTTGFARSSGRLAVTVPYMSPEQMSGARPAPGWDVWSLAVMAYEMLSGVHPFSAAAGGSGMPVTRPAPIRSFAPELPTPADAFFDRALSLEPSRRPATAPALVRDLQAAITS